METIGDNIFHLDEIIGGPTLIVSDAGVVLVDAGMPGDEQEILAALASLGRRPDECDAVLITHADVDHVGGLAAIVAATAAKVYAPEGEADVVDGTAPMRGAGLAEGVAVERRLSDGDVLPFFGGIEVIGTPGHTLGHVAYYVQGEDVLLAGDCLHNTEGSLAVSMPEYTDDAEQADQTVRKLARLGPGTICVGHGPSIIGDAAAQLTRLAAEQP